MFTNLQITMKYTSLKLKAILKLYVPPIDLLVVTATQETQ